MLKDKFSVITPMRDRPRAFELCRRWVLRQTILPPQWVIVDDGNIPLHKDLVSEPFITYIRRPPSSAKWTLKENMLTALKYVKYDFVIMVEDDDWYSPEYFEVMLSYFEEGYNLIGQGDHIDYHLPTRRYCLWKNRHHASLCSTGFTCNLFDTIKRGCEYLKSPYLDLWMWKAYNGKKKVFLGKQVVIGIKGLPGRLNIAQEVYFSHIDKDFSFLKSHIGDDIKYYLEISDSNQKYP